MPSLFRIFRFMRPYGWYLFFGFWATALPVAMELSVPRLLQFIIDEGIRPRQMDMILLGAFWMFVAAMIGAASTLGQGWCRAVVSQGLAFDIRHALFRHIQSLSFANLDQMQTGNLMTRVSSDDAPRRRRTGGGHVASAWTSSQPWNTTASPVKRTDGYCRVSRSSVT